MPRDACGRIGLGAIALGLLVGCISATSGIAAEKPVSQELAGHLVFIGLQHASATTAFESNVYSAEFGKPMTSPTMLTPAGKAVWMLVWNSRLGKLLYLENSDKSAGQWRTLASLDHTNSDDGNDVWPNTDSFYHAFAFSPDGRYTAGVRQDRGNYLWVADVSGTEPLHQIRGQAATYLSAPAWAPDDSRIVFVGALDGNINYVELFTVDRNGEHLRQLTDLPSWVPWWRRLFQIPEPPRWDNHFSTEPRWSPDGQWIVFQSFQGIYRMRPDGSALSLIVKRAIHPAWSPDGKMLAYVASRGKDEESAIYVSFADGSDEKQVTAFQASMNYSSLYWVN